MPAKRLLVLVPATIRKGVMTDPSVEKERKKERKKDESDIATGVNYGAASTWSWFKSMRNHETGITRNRGSRRPNDHYCLLPF
jgi:hypothetical protein